MDTATLSKLTVLFTVFFFAVAIMFAIAITKLSATDDDLHTVLYNQTKNQSINVTIAENNAAKAAKYAAKNAALGAKSRRSSH